MLRLVICVEAGDRITAFTRAKEASMTFEWICSVSIRTSCVPYIPFFSLVLSFFLSFSSLHSVVLSFSFAIRTRLVQLAVFPIYIHLSCFLSFFRSVMFFLSFVLLSSRWSGLATV